MSLWNFVIFIEQGYDCIMSVINFFLLIDGIFYLDYPLLFL
jgi:hypothetical protein